MIKLKDMLNEGVKLGAGKYANIYDMKKEIGRYKIEVTTYVNKKGNIYVLETTFDTKTGKVIERKRFYHTKYGEKKRK